MIVLTKLNTIWRSFFPFIFRICTCRKKSFNCAFCWTPFHFISRIYRTVTWAFNSWTVTFFLSSVASMEKPNVEKKIKSGQRSIHSTLESRFLVTLTITHTYTHTFPFSLLWRARAPAIRTFSVATVSVRKHDVTIANDLWKIRRKLIKFHLHDVNRVIWGASSTGTKTSNSQTEQYDWGNVRCRVECCAHHVIFGGEMRVK